jgi:DNA-directed RNA polymerase specialized sigma24 family protein
MRGAKPGFSLDEYPNFELPDQAEAPDESAERAERAHWLYTAMSALTERDREAIRLVDLNEMTIVEAATQLTLTKAAAKSAYFRARLRLGRVLRSEAPTKKRRKAKARHAEARRTRASS